MNRAEKLRKIRGLISGYVNPELLKNEIEVWIQDYQTDTFRRVKSEETLTREEINKRESKIENSKLIKVEFIAGKQIL